DETFSDCMSGLVKYNCPVKTPMGLLLAGSVFVVGIQSHILSACAAVRETPGGWTTAAPRDEIRPEFSFKPHAGRTGSGSLIIEADGREGLDGYWTRTFPVQGGHYYQFQAFRKTSNVES